MRSKSVEVAGKNILIQEKRIKEIKELASEINFDFNKLASLDLKNQNLLSEIFAILSDRIMVIFPQLTEEDLDNAYMSEVEALLEGFLDVNFSTLKKVYMKATTMM